MSNMEKKKSFSIKNVIIGLLISFIVVLGFVAISNLWFFWRATIIFSLPLIIGAAVLVLLWKIFHRPEPGDSLKLNHWFVGFVAIPIVAIALFFVVKIVTRVLIAVING